jgi:hypothetical protein
MDVLKMGRNAELSFHPNDVVAVFHQGRLFEND